MTSHTDKRSSLGRSLLDYFKHGQLVCYFTGLYFIDKDQSHELLSAFIQVGIFIKFSGWVLTPFCVAAWFILRPRYFYLYVPNLTRILIQKMTRNKKKTLKKKGRKERRKVGKKEPGVCASTKLTPYICHCFIMACVSQSKRNIQSGTNKILYL